MFTPTTGHLKRPVKDEHNAINMRRWKRPMLDLSDGREGVKMTHFGAPVTSFPTPTLDYTEEDHKIFDERGRRSYYATRSRVLAIGKDSTTLYAAPPDGDAIRPRTCEHRQSHACDITCDEPSAEVFASDYVAFTTARPISRSLWGSISAWLVPVASKISFKIFA
jgi:hypothetical protein